jgi:hypothetical protein
VSDSTKVASRAERSICCSSSSSSSASSRELSSATRLSSSVGVHALRLGADEHAHADRRERQRQRMLRADDGDTVVAAIRQDARHRRIDGVRRTFDALDKAAVDRQQHAGDAQRRVAAG